MRSNVAYLVVLMVMLACFAVYQLHPPGLIHLPGNLLIGGGLIFGAAAVGLRRPWSYPLGLFCAGLPVLGGLLSFRQSLWTSLPSHPVVWIVAGLYLMLRLTLNKHGQEEAALKARARDERDGDEA